MCRRSRAGFAALVIAGASGCGELAPVPEELEGALDGVEELEGLDEPPAEDPPPPFEPLRVPPELLWPGTPGSAAPDLVLSAPLTLIDTTALTIGGATSVFFVKENGYAILFANLFSVQGPVKVTGASPLIVVANDRAVISSLVDVSAVGRTPGPGAAATGPGIGGAGQSVFLIDTRASSGGGGASHGSSGAAGGTSNASLYPAGAAGTTYSTGPHGALIGGSRGGHGGFSFGAAGAGGAGGGALQISAATSITMTSSAQLKASGGGGAGGGFGPVGGGGGGSGGEIFLEAPSIALAGRITANGGGGGGGGGNSGSCATCVPGRDGQDGGTSGTPAAGGGGGIPQGSPGGAGGIVPFPPARPGNGFNSKGGGGGGGVGRIWLRYRAATPPTGSAIIAPPPSTDSSMP